MLTLTLTLPLPLNPTHTPTLTLIIAPPRVAMFQCGEDADQLGVVMNSCDLSREGRSMDPPALRDWIFSLSRLSIFACELGPKCCTKVAHLCVAFCCLFRPYMHINGRDGAREATALLARGCRGGSPIPRGTFLLLCSSICTCNIGLVCSEMLLPAYSLWIFVAFAHLRYLKMVLRFCVEGHAWVRVGVSKLRCDCS